MSKSKQISIRLTLNHGEKAELTKQAAELGIRPATLAKMRYKKGAKE